MPKITQRYILAFWLPLAASWVLMGLEGPFVQAMIARLPEPELNLAAFGIAMSLSITIESPVIMLLATSTALCRDAAAYRVLRRFMLGLNACETCVAVALAFTPLYDWVVPGLMGVPAGIALAARSGLQIMTLWSASIGWRRFYQGILIRFGQTRRVGYGTIVRLLSSASTAAALALWGDWPGVWVGGCALMAGVISEATFVTWLVQPSLHRLLLMDADSAPLPSLPLTLRQVMGFHLPLAATSLLTLLSQPLVNAALARTALAELSLAAWPVAWSLTFLPRSLGMASQEVVIALIDGPDSLPPMRRFTWGVALGSSLLLGLVAFTPLAGLYFVDMMGVSPQLARFAIPGLQAALALPALTALQSWLRALLMKAQATAAIYQAMGLNLALTIVALVLGVIWHAPGIPMASVALTVAMLAELALLEHRLRRSS